MRKLKIVYRQDPGHGWIVVPFKYLQELSIEKNISHCSYLRGETAYLEEDCDADKFMAAAKEAGWEIKIDSRFSNRASPIRSYPSYAVV